jgi:hypothetical protein
MLCDNLLELFVFLPELGGVRGISRDNLRSDPIALLDVHHDCDDGYGRAFYLCGMRQMYVRGRLDGAEARRGCVISRDKLQSFAL